MSINFKLPVLLDRVLKNQSKQKEDSNDSVVDSIWSVSSKEALSGLKLASHEADRKTVPKYGLILGKPG
jgi:hypothetical protein